MIYADEMFYQNKYLLGRKPVISTGFAFYARSASQIIDRFTFDRLKHTDDIPEVVKMCCCELAEAEFSREKTQKQAGGKTSEKVGTWSASYADVASSSVADDKLRASIVYKWLGDTGFCYQGV
ncbi:MAG: hypothetical protein PHV18_14840 [Lachnospiraceae bacterium]|nr:hypothetical protein [Lachnospiraceae bacterium]